jgi:hypothetical protein
MVSFRYNPGIFEVTGQRAVGKRQVSNMDRKVTIKHINKILKDKKIDEKAMCKKYTV